MPCYYPLTGYYSRDKNPSGKRSLVFSIGAAFSPVPVKVPCGQCIGCRLERSRQWAIRCVHEAQMWPVNSFVTLTYDDDNLPPGGTLVKRDLQLFMKRLRRDRDERVRFYGCGEYGEITRRPHYHVILFNCGFRDQKLFKRSGDAGYYTSDELRNLWPAGHNVISAVTFDSAAYVARYVMKKVTGDAAQAHYETVDRYGEIHDLVPEFTNMSRRSGIGATWFAKYGAHSYNFDAVVINGREVKPPRYYDGMYEVLDADKMAMLKVNRRRKAASMRSDQTPERRRVREAVASAKLKMKGRVL